MNYSPDLLTTIRHSADLEPERALVFDLSLQTTETYKERPEYQVFHSQALLERMHRSQDIGLLWNFSETQRKMPNFSKSLLLQEMYARGLVLIAQKDATTEIHRESLDRLFSWTRYQESLELQKAIAALLLESIANCKRPSQARELEQEYRKLPDLDDPEIAKMASLAKDLINRTNRQAVMKVDLRRKTPGLLRALGKIVGLGDYRMRVWLGGSANYKQLVVKVAARDEESARDAVQSFMKNFLSPDQVSSQEILDVFPPGSSWNSGRYPVLQV